MPKKTTTKKQVDALVHEDAKRKNIPTAEFESVMDKDAQTPIQLAYERRNRDLDPQLVWRGKDEQDWSDLVVQAPPLYIQEKVHPKVLIDDLLRQTVDSEKSIVDSSEDANNSSLPTNHSKQIEFDLFGDFNGLPSEEAKTEFYQHDANWTNRMILGDSLQVMASLAEREGLRGQVQCIYLDPPYGIKFNSNFQWSTTSRDVKDGNQAHITREPEMVKAFRDTWRDGIHTYLTYLRDRLTVARDLLSDSGSIFVQIGDENVHRVRALMDEVFGEENFVSQICYTTTSGFTSQFLSRTGDFILWYSKSSRQLKYRQKFIEKADPLIDPKTKYDQVESPEGQRKSLSKKEKVNISKIPDGLRLFRYGAIDSQDPPPEPTPVIFQGETFTPPKGRHWTANYPYGMQRLIYSRRLVKAGKKLGYIRYFDDFPIRPIHNIWTDIGGTVQSRSDPKVYVVQTGTSVVERCILMATDPGDLVLDPTCGSGTTAYVAEQWGRRWITIDTSRVALALARARIMGAKYPFFLLSDSKEGQQKEAELTRSAPSQAPTYGNIRQGFVYERVPHITLKSIANNAEIDVIWEEWQKKIVPALEKLSSLVGEQWIAKHRKTIHSSLSTNHSLAEWEVPRDLPKAWPAEAKTLHETFWDARIARQREIDASIAAKADSEYLYDKPYEDKKKVRVAGPFTVESLSPHRTLGVDEDDELIDPLKPKEGPGRYNEKQDFAAMILENLKTAGVQQAQKEDKINFTSLKPWPGDLVCAEGRFTVSDEWLVNSGQQNKLSTKNSQLSTGDSGTELRAAIFIGPEFGTVARADLVAAAREAGDADFDVLIACAFNYEARTTEFDKLGRLPVLKARMNADLHMADELKNTGSGNLFVIFGEPDIELVSEEWIVDSFNNPIAPYEIFKLLSGTDSLAEINGLERGDLLAYAVLSNRREIWDYLADAASSHLDPSKHCGRSGPPNEGGVSTVAWHSAGLSGGVGDLCDTLRKAGLPQSTAFRELAEQLRGDKQNAAQLNALTQQLERESYSLSTAARQLSTRTRTQVRVNGVDVFKPQTGKIESSNTEDIACWFIDTDYNEESFFVRHAYFLGAADPYKSLKTTLKAEINAEAWESLYSDTSRPFNKPKSGRIAVKVINHLGDEVMKVFRV